MNSTLQMTDKWSLTTARLVSSLLQVISPPTLQYDTKRTGLMKDV